MKDVTNDEMLWGAVSGTFGSRKHSCFRGDEQENETLDKEEKGRKEHKMKSVELKGLGDADFQVREAYKTLRTNLQFCGQDVKVIAITSCTENEGKTSTAINLAHSLAELGKDVLFIDADLRKSVLTSRHMVGKNIKGLAHYLTGQCGSEGSGYQWY